jgi:FkbM family methyltransferase
MRTNNPPDEPTWALSTVTAGGKRFCIAYDKGVTRETDPVAAAYRAGSLKHLSTLIQVAMNVLQPGSRVLDLGAHLGGFALTAAALGCEVIAVEASAQQAALLRTSAEHNDFRKLDVIHAAVGEASGVVEFSPHGPWGHVATPATGMPSVSVPAIRLDDLLAQRGWQSVHFIKLDVEGSEVRAIRGMQRLLQRPDAPPIFFESNRHTLGFYGDSPEGLRAQFHRFGYAVYHVRSGILIPASETDTQEKTVVDYLAAKQLPPRLSAWRRTSARSLWWRLKRVVHGALLPKLISGELRATEAQRFVDGVDSVDEVDSGKRRRDSR